MFFLVLYNNYDHAKYFLNIKFFFFALELSKVNEEIKLFYHFLEKYNTILLFLF